MEQLQEIAGMEALLEILIPSIIGLAALQGLFQPKWSCGSTGSTPNTGRT